MQLFLICQGRWQSQMQQLRDMGIQDEELMLRALQATDGDIQAALELIFAGGPGLWTQFPMDKGESWKKVVLLPGNDKLWI